MPRLIGTPKVKETGTQNLIMGHVTMPSLGVC